MNFFRWLVVFSMMVFCFWFFLPFAPVRVPPDIQSILLFNGYDALVSLSHPVVVICSFTLRAVVTIGLFLYFRWSFLLFVLWLLANALLSPLGGVIVSTGGDAVVGYMATLLDGVLLCLSYFYVWQRRNVHKMI